MTPLGRRQLIRLYFGQRPWAAIGKLGATGVLVCLFHSVGLWLVAGALLAVIALFTADRLGPADAQVDAWFQATLRDVEKTGLARLGLMPGNLKRPPLIVHGPVWRPQAGVSPDDIRVHRGADGGYRFNVNRVLVLYLTEHSLGIYACTCDSVREVRVAVHSETYLYRNIVGVSVYEPAEVHDGKTEHHYKVGSTTFVPRQAFRMTFKNGEDITIDVAVREVGREDDGRPMAHIDAVAAAVRQMTIEVHARV